MHILSISKLKRKSYLGYVTLMLIAAFICGSFIAPPTANALVLDSNASKGCANLTGIYLNGDTNQSLTVGQYVYNAADGTLTQKCLEAEYLNVPLQPSFKIQYPKNIVGKSTNNYYNYSVNKELISLVRADDESVVPASVEMNVSVNNYLMLNVSGDNALLPQTTYKIVIQPGIISGQSPYPATADQYVGLFKTGPLWPAEALLSTNNILSDGLRLSWPLINYSFVKGFKIYAGETLLETINDPGIGYYDVSGLSPDTGYIFTVKAIDENENPIGQLMVEAKTAVQTEVDIAPPYWNPDKELKASAITASSLRLNWQGAADNTAVTGYKVLRDGALLTDTLGGDVSSFDISGLTADTTYLFEIQARDAQGNWSTDGPTLELTTGLPLNAEAVMTPNQPVYLDERVVVTLQDAPQGSNHRVEVRRAEREVPQNHASNGVPVEWTMLYYANLKDAGGVYGFNLQADGAANNDTVTVTLPITDEEMLAQGKVAVYLLQEYGEAEHYWMIQDTAIDPVSQTATVEITGCNQNVILGVFSHVFYPDGMSVSWHEIADDLPSITIELLVQCSPGGLTEMVVERTDVMTGDFKNIVIREDFQQRGPVPQFLYDYVDTDVQMGHFYVYKFVSATDRVNCVGHNWRTAAASPGDREDRLQSLKQWVLDGNYLQFANGDSADSITRNFCLRRTGPTHDCHWDIVGSSDRPDIIAINSVHYGTATVTRPQEDTVVNLTVQVVSGRYQDPYNNEPYLSENLTIPVTVKKAGPDPETYAIDYDANPLNIVQNKNMAWDDFNRVIQSPDVKTITFSKPFDLMHSSQADPNGRVSPYGDNINVYDCQGKTLKATQDMDCLFNCPRGPEDILKNAIIDLDHKQLKAVFNCQGVLKLENVSFINAENVDYGISIWANEKWNEHFSADNCQFGQFNIAAVLQSTPRYNYQNVQPGIDDYNLNWVNSNPQFVKFSNCTFDGGGQPGFGIVNCYGFTSIENCTFSGYSGAVPTGITAANDSSDGLNPYLVYKGIPDATPSAAILLKEMAAAAVNGNTISACDNGILVWSGEGNFNHYDMSPPAGYQGFVKVAGKTVANADLAAQIRDALLTDNIITAASQAVQVKYALDRYNLIDVFPNFLAPILSDLDAKILAGNPTNTLQALKAEILGLKGLEPKDTRIYLYFSTDVYHKEVAAARTAKGSALTLGEIQSAIDLANDKADIVVVKRDILRNLFTWTFYEPRELNPSTDGWGVRYTWTAVSGPDAFRVTLTDGKAIINSLPDPDQPNGSITLTQTLSKGAASDTIDYTIILSSQPEDLSERPVGRVDCPLITMASDQVTAEPGDKWILKITSAEWDNGTTVKDTLNNDDVTVTGLPDGMGYTAVKGSGNTVEISLNGTAVSPVTQTVSVTIVLKSSGVTESGISDSKPFGVMITPFAEEDVIDYTPGPMGTPFLDNWIAETIAWNRLQRDAQVTSVKTVTLQKPIYMFKDGEVDDSKIGRDIQYVLDFQGKTIKAGADMDFLLCSERGETVTIKNAVIDLNHKNLKTVFNDKGRIHLENVQITNAENVNFGAMLWAHYGFNEQFTADNCQFGAFKVAAVLQWTPIFIAREMEAANALPAQVKLVNSTFDGGGLPGYGVVGCYGSLVVENCVFRGYKGNVNTGINMDNDHYLIIGNLPYGESKSILAYRGIPDGSPSAGILLKETSAAALDGNTISDCDNGTLVWTGEKNFRHDDLKPGLNYAGVITVNGIAVNSQNSGRQAYKSLVSGNAIGFSSCSSGVLIENAADRYDRKMLYTPVPVQAAQPVVKLGDQVVSSLQSGQTYTITVPASIIGSTDNIKAYIVLRGGKGARAERGGSVLYDTAVNPSQRTTEVQLEGNELHYSFSVPADMTGKIYGSIIIWDNQQTWSETDSLDFALDIK